MAEAREALMETGAPVAARSSPRAPRVPVLPDSLAKRGIDLLLGTTMLAVTSPLWAAIALAIKLDDGGPVFYRQTRYGRGARIFRVTKFRTMIPGSDERFGIRQARERDERITRVGRVLRRFGLDELPQILNILAGDMSFVGPRPLAVGEIVEDRRGRLVHWETLRGFSERLAVHPGLTSLATVYLARDAHPRRKFAYDLRYVRRRSLALDLRLIALSYRISLFGRWERRSAKV